MKEIGGYFELELTTVQRSERFKSFIAVNSARNALELIFSQLVEKPRLVHLPAYTCDAVIAPLDRLKIPYRFYRINQNLEIPILPEVADDEYIIVNNYFGIKDTYVNSLAKEYGDRIIIDNAQALYSPAPKGIKAIYSLRKFVGIPDGGFATGDFNTNMNLEKDYSWQNAIHLLRRLDETASSAFESYKKSEFQLGEKPIREMSQLSSSILNSIDHNVIIEKRRQNFKNLHKAIGALNHMKLPRMDTFACPMVYPFWTDDNTLRQCLISAKIYVATYWPNVFNWCSPATIEYQLAKKIIPLPIDQRYSKKDMEKIINIIQKKHGSIN